MPGVRRGGHDAHGRAARDARRHPAAPGPATRDPRAALLPRHERGPGRAGDGGQPRHRQVRHVPGHRRHWPDAQGGIMSTLEEEIRDTLRSEAARLREVRPLQLPPAAAAHESRAVPRASWARWLRAWHGPAVAVAVVALVAGALVILKSLRNEPAAPMASTSTVESSASAAAAAAGGVVGVAVGAAPRYYVELGWAKNDKSWAIIVGDRQAGKTIATFPLAKGGTLFDAGVSGGADDRTFVVSAAPSSGVAGPPTWYRVRIFPDAADPVRITKLPIEFPANEGVREIALSGDGTELAVVSMTGNAAFKD